MKLVHKVWLGVGAAVLAALLVFGTLSYRHARETVESELLQKGQALHDMLMAMRRTYHRQFVDSGLPLDERTIGFLPAHAMIRISREYQKFDTQGIRFNNVSDRPRNPANRADPVEMQAIAWFREHPREKERLVQYVDARGERHYHYATPIRTEPYCLNCHGDRDAAPPTIRERYDAGYGYHIGELRGVLSIKLPARTAEARILGNWLREQAIHVGSLVLALLVGGLLMQAMVVRKLTRFRDAARHIAGGDYSDRLEVNGRDETDQLASAINQMAEAIQQREHSLRQSATVFENSLEGIIITDAEATITDVNRAFTSITGYSRGEALGASPRLLQSGRHDRAFYQTLWSSLLRTGQWRGEIWNRRKSGELYPEWLSITAVRNADGYLSHYVGVFTDISDLRRSQDELDHQAHHDPLTGLPNRLLLQAHMERTVPRADRDGHLLALLFLDLDRFKQINDSLGHFVGDRLLREVADRLRENVRASDTVARLGGDEFLVLMEQLRSAEDAAILAEKLNLALATAFVLDGQEFYLTSSIGISLYPRDGRDLDVLLRNADAAMYRAKDGGRNTYQFYTQELTTFAYERMTLETLLRGAVGRNELRVHYQPQIDLAGGRVVGAEALVRWQHPDLGLVPPNRFIPLAEETGLIVPIGEWVLENACRQARAWIDEGLPLGQVAVNVAAQQIQRSDFVSSVRAILAATGLPAERLELEVTETFVMNQPDRAIGVLLDLRGLGVSLAIDDFGTGYSSLAHLKRMPIAKLKIDRSFIRDIPDDAEDVAIASAIIGLGHSLGLTVIAEGVETGAQHDFLRDKGCQQTQGYLHSHPLPAEEMHDFLKQHADGGHSPTAGDSGPGY